MILLAGAAADADRTDHCLSLHQRNATGEDHDFSIVGSVQPVEISARLTKPAELFG